MLIKELLTERKQVGILYHFTGFNSLISLASSGFTFNTRNEALSFSRDYQMPRSAGEQSSFSFASVRIAVDGDRLSSKYKIVPLLGLQDPNDTDLFGKQKKKNIAN